MASGQDPKKTLAELYNILKDHVRSFADDNDHVSNERDRLRNILQHTADQLQKDRRNKLVMARRSYPQSKDKSEEIYENESKSRQTLASMEQHELKEFREKIKVEKSLHKTKDILQTLEKKLPDKLEEDKVEESDIPNLLLEVKSLINECLCVQSHTDSIVEKISTGVQKLLDQKQSGRPKAFHEEMMTFPVPAELSYACGKIQKKGVSFRQFGEALNLPEDLLTLIEEQHVEEQEEERFLQVIREWARVTKAVNISNLVGACYSLGGTLVREEPLSKEDTKTLLQNVDYLCDNMMDVPLVLPHLVSTLVLSPGLCEYIVNPPGRIERIIRLVDILCIRKNGLKEFCVALRKSEQNHVAEQLQGPDIQKFLGRSNSVPNTTDDNEVDTMTDDSKSSGHNILEKIVRLLSNEGFIKT